MSGRLRASFRSGNLAEDLGFLLLKGIAAIADVPRQEDVGIDAIATLLRRDADGNCYAEDSFLVQLKSASTKQIEYNDHEIQWFVYHSQPMFIGLVSLEDAQISLYSTIFVNHAVKSLKPEKVTILFGASPLPPFIRGQEFSPWKDEPDRGLTVWLGEPVLKWTIGDLTNKMWVEDVYQFLKKFLAIVRHEIDLLSLGHLSSLNWQTNNIGSIIRQSGVSFGSSNNFSPIVERLAPCLQNLMLSALWNRDESWRALMIAMLDMKDALRNLGEDIDPENIFTRLFNSIEKQNFDVANSE